MRSIILTLLFALPLSAQEQKADLPRVVLLGDSIRLSYAPIVEKALAGKATFHNPKANGGDSGNLLKNLDAWVIQQKPDVVHFNAGIHDSKRFRKTKEYQVSLEKYEANLRKIVERIRKETKATVLFAVTTPILSDRAGKQREKADYEVLEECVVEFNAVARKLMKELNVPVNDVRALFPDKASVEKAMTADGVHFTGEGSRMLGESVAKFIEGHMPKR